MVYLESSDQVTFVVVFCSSWVHLSERFGVLSNKMYGKSMMDEKDKPRVVFEVISHDSEVQFGKVWSVGFSILHLFRRE